MDISISRLLEKSTKFGTSKIAVINAQDLDVLLSLKKAVEAKIVSPILFGKAKEIENLLKKHSLKFDAEIVDCPTDVESAESAVKMVSSGKADILMKGLIASSTMLRAILNKEWGLNKGSLLSHVTLIIPENKPAFLLTDGGIVIAPDLAKKKAIIENAVETAHKLGVKTPKVALICAIETVNPEMPATVDASSLSKMNKRGQIKECIVDGPLAFDNAVSIEAANHKGIKSEVAGQADILVVPNIETGNSIFKTFGFFTKAKLACLVVGAKAPAILTSRSDSSETKFNSIVFAKILADKQMKIIDEGEKWK